MEISITTDNHVVYRVSKNDNDGDFIKLFVYNSEGLTNQEVRAANNKYACYFIVSSDGVFFHDEDFCLNPESLEDAVKHICKPADVNAALLMLRPLVHSIHLLHSTILKEQEHLDLLIASDDFWGSELDVTTGNDVVLAASELMGFDIAEDSTWVAATCKATAQEICEYNLSRLTTLIQSFKGEG